MSNLKAGLNGICMTLLLAVSSWIGVFVSVGVSLIFPLLPCDPVVRGCWVDAASQSPPRVHMCVHTAKMAASFRPVFLSTLDQCHSG